MHFLTVQLIHVFLVPMHLDLDLGMRLYIYVLPVH